MSRYENDELVPSKIVLLALARLAASPVEIAAIREAYGPENAALLEVLGTSISDQAQDLLARVERFRDGLGGSRDRFLIQAEQLGKASVVPSWLVQAIDVWMRYGTDPAVMQVFEDLPIRLADAVSLRNTRAPSPQREARSPRQKGQQLVVWTKCPQTGKPFSTGVTIDEKTWKSARFDHNPVSCPHCHSTHYWSKKDAWIDVAKSA